jgi:hypothetical protein
MNIYDCDIQDVVDTLETVTQVKTLIDLLQSTTLCTYISKQTILKMYQDVWIKTLKKKINDYGINADKLFSLILRYKMLITGSILLQVITGQSYESFDIDIIANTINDEIIKDFEKLTNSKMQCLNKDVDQKYKNIGAFEVYDFYVGDQLVQKKIQLIVPHLKKGVDYINNFDLDICKNYCDFSKIVVGNYDNICNNIAVYSDNNSSFQNFLKRIIKYSNRGFDIHISTNMIKKLRNVTCSSKVLKDLKNKNIYDGKKTDQYEIFCEIMYGNTHDILHSDKDYVMICDEK